MVKAAQADVPTPQVIIQRETLFDSVMRKIKGDQLTSSDATSSSPGFPYTYPSVYKRPIGSLFALNIEDALLQDMYRRYPVARRVVDSPIEESFARGFQIHTDPRWSPEQQNELIGRALWLYNTHRFQIQRFCKLVRLYGHSELLFGWNDDKRSWNTPVRAGEDDKQKKSWSYVQPVPKPYEVELKETDTIPIRIQYLSVAFGAETISNIHPSRFIHAMNPKLIEEDKLGESCLLPVANIFTIKIHSDWSVGQSLWRNAAGLLGMFAPKRSLTEQEIALALNSVDDRNAKTTVYIPFGWNVKNILKGQGNVAIARTYKLIFDNIAAGTGIPTSILLGSQKGVLDPSSDDNRQYSRTVEIQQEGLLTPTLEKFFRYGQLAGYIPPGPIRIEWNSLDAKLTETEKLRDKVEQQALYNLNQYLQNNMVQPEQIVKLLGKRRK